jgi:hypothetical protein
VVSVTNPYGRILCFLDRSRYFSPGHTVPVYSQQALCVSLSLSLPDAEAGYVTLRPTMAQYHSLQTDIAFPYRQFLRFSLRPLHICQCSLSRFVSHLSASCPCCHPARYAIAFSYPLLLSAKCCMVISLLSCAIQPNCTASQHTRYCSSQSPL